MTPLKLTLKGFIGIRDGMGRDELTLDLESVKGALVAITGPNGTGKTTVLDNLHPYRIMPSRATSYSANAFSYWSQIGTEARKVLEWSHAGVRYKSDLVFRVSGKKQSAEAYLQFQDVKGEWCVCAAADGTVSDGKATTYDACVESILGSPELYFTAAFSCQGRKLLSGYTNAEIKSLLSSLLGLGHIEDLAATANEKRLMAERGLQALRDSGSEYAGLEIRLNDMEANFIDETGRLVIQQQQREGKRGLVTFANENLAKARTDKLNAAQTEERALGLQQQLNMLASQENAELAEARAAITAAAQSLADAITRHGGGIVSLESQKYLQEQELKTQETLIDRRAEVDKAIADLANFESGLADLDSSIARCEADGEKVKDAPANHATARAALTALDRELSDIASQRKTLERRSALVDRVPCAGMELQSTCELLADARTAQAQITTLDQHKGATQDKHTAAVHALDEAEKAVAIHTARSAEWRAINASRNALLKSIGSVKSIAVMKVAVDQAETAANRIRATITDLDKRISQAKQDQTVELALLKERGAECDRKPQVIQERYTALRDPIQKDLDSLPTGASAAADVTAAEKALADAQALLDDAEKSLDATKATIAKLEAEKANLDALARVAASHDTKVTAAADDLAHWTTLCKALGPNGVIALVIDDAGPTLAGITNDLLRATFGPRFSVRIDTQHQNTDGTTREDFDIVVFDSNTGSSKSLVDMSGGERIWNDEALRSAIAIFQNQRSGHNYGCRMSDESDGALDAEKKQQYMAMKREVLKIAGLDREFFISHSTSTWELADAVIDLGRFIGRASDAANDATAKAAASTMESA